MDHEQYIQAVLLGQVLTRAISMRVEPFSGNALYYPRRTGTMEQYKTVKEVCALTGLTGKHYVDEGTECLSALSGPRSHGAHHSVRCFFFCLMRTIDVLPSNAAFYFK